MLFSVEQAFAGKDERRAALKTPAWEVIANPLPGQYLTQPWTPVSPSLGLISMVIWLCACVRYWLGRGLEYVCSLL